MIETWKSIYKYPDYQISNLGRIKSLKFGKEKILKCIKNNKSGYLHLDLYYNGKKCNNQIHILVYENFNNYKLKSNECVHHKDENKLNNNLDNLEFMTRFAHKSFHMSGKKHPMYGIHRCGSNAPNYGKSPTEETRKKLSEKMKGRYCGEKSPCSILTNESIKKIRLDLNNNISQRKIAKKFGVSQSLISMIKNNKRWEGD